MHKLLAVAMEQGYVISVDWSPGFFGISGNEIAHKAAKLTQPPQYDEIAV